MAKPFGKSLLGLVAALVASGLVAQGDPPSFKDAVLMLRMGQTQEALDALRAIVRDNPSHEEALQLMESADEDAFIRLRMEGGEFGQIAELILNRVRSEREELSRDEGAIADLVTTVCENDDLAERHKASATLVADHGEYAVPELVKRLASEDDVVLGRALVALRSIGRGATHALIAALESSNPAVRANAAAAVSNIGDRRAAASIAGLLRDEQESVRAVAGKILEKWGIRGDAVALHVDNARNYLNGTGIGMGERSDVVWSWDDEAGLVHEDVPGQLYALELARKSALGALRADTANQEAQMLLAQSFLGQVAVIDSVGESGDLGDAADKRDGLRMAALSTGPDVLGAALSDARENRMIPVAVAAVDALQSTLGREALGNSALVAALEDTDSRVSYAAALAVTEISGGADVPASGMVVDRLASAVGQRALRIIQVIDPRPATEVAVEVASVKKDNVIAHNATATSGLSNLLKMPACDVVVINEVLPDRLPEDVISVIRGISKFDGIKIIVMTKDEDSASERFEDVAFVAADLDGAALTAAVDSALEGSEIGPAQARAEAVAVDAAAALSSLANAGLDLGVQAREALRGQLDRGADVAVPAVHALGRTGDASDLDALIGAITGGASDDVKAAAASAAGAIFGRMPGEIGGDAMNALMGVLGGDAAPEVKAAVAAALGKAKKAPGDLLRLVDMIGGAKADL